MQLLPILLACSGKGSHEPEPTSVDPGPQVVVLTHVELPRSEHAMGLPLDKGCVGDPETGACMSAVVVEASLSGIALDNNRVMALEDGLIPESARRGALITPLYDRADETVTQLRMLEKSAPFEVTALRFSAATALLILDARLPNKTVRDIMYTLGQAQIADFYYVVDDPSPSAWQPLGLNSN